MYNVPQIKITTTQIYVPKIIKVFSPCIFLLFGYACYCVCIYPLFAFNLVFPTPTAFDWDERDSKVL